jgi:hypothetical protein
MMSAAILLAAVGEQTKVPSVSADHGSANTPSFASSLAKQFQDSELTQGKTSLTASATMSKELRAGTGTKRPEEVEEMPAGLKTGGGELKTVVTFEGPKLAIAGKAAIPQLKPAVAQSTKDVEGESRVGEEDSEATASSHLAGSLTAPAASDGLAAAPAEAPTPRVDISENKPTSASSEGTLIITQAVVSPIGLPKEMMARGSVKADKSEASQKKSPKDIEIDVTGKSNNAGVATGNAAGGIAAVAAATPAAGDATANNSGKAVNLNPVELLPRAGSSGAGVRMTAGGTVRSEAVVSKMGLSDAAATPASQDVPNALPKAATETEKVNATSVQVSDGDRTPNSEPGPTVLLAHSAVATVKGIVTATPGLVGAGSPLGGAVTARVPGGEGSVPSSAVRVPLNEQPGMVTMPMDGAPRMLSATPNALEVGIQDGAHGWVRVRAEMTDGGSVNALVSAASPQGQEMLHRELPSLTAYLQQEKVTVNSVVVHVPVQAAVEVRDSAGLNGGNDQMAQRGSEGGGQFGERPTSNESERAMKYRTSGVDEDGSMQLDRHSVGGGWLSVRA